MALMALHSMLNPAHNNFSQFETNVKSIAVFAFESPRPVKNPTQNEYHSDIKTWLNRFTSMTKKETPIHQIVVRGDAVPDVAPEALG